MAIRRGHKVRIIVACRYAIALAALSSSIAPVAAEEFDGPTFQRGLWRFERSLSNGGGSAHLPSATFVSSQQTTRCVDPTNAMRETFRPVAVGNCRSAPPERIRNRYVFSLRCDFMGPARTTIDVESDTAYVEIHEFIASKPPRKEMIIARRIGECGDSNPGAVALDPSTPEIGRFGLSSAQSKPVRR
jgi:hypothetical protein